jgi:hypothetical protein
LFKAALPLYNSNQRPVAGAAAQGFARMDMEEFDRG